MSTQRIEQAVTLESILEKENLKQALRRVILNKGAAGVDKMGVEELTPYLFAHPHELTDAVKSGKYKPQAVRRVYIPKEGTNEKRPLGVPTVRDRLVQQAIAQELSRWYEPRFSDSSYGFRPNRSAQDAINKACLYARNGYEFVIDLDLSKFFDTINHSKLLQVLSREVKDGRVISLIDRFLKAPIEDGGTLIPNRIGSPQGGPVSPVLANIMLNELDHELERRGHKFVRYADDMIILCQSRRAAERVYTRIRKYIEEKLLLRVNEQKTSVCQISDKRVKFLGYGFAKFKTKRDAEATYHPVVHEKSKKKLLRSLREITNRNRGQSTAKFIGILTWKIRGWVNYFKVARMAGFVRNTDAWLRRRIRAIYWKQWKTIRNRGSNLTKYGASPSKAWEWSNTRLGVWRIAGSWIMATTMTNQTLEGLGWPTLQKYYKG